MKKPLRSKVVKYCKQKGYTWTFEGIMEQYRKYLVSEYISHTAKDVVHNVIIPHFAERANSIIKGRE